MIAGAFKHTTGQVDDNGEEIEDSDYNDDDSEVNFDIADLITDN